MADVNNDSWLDIYVCSSGHINSGNRKNKLYINNHNLTFTESAQKYGLDNDGYTTQASFFDYDGDGDLDCFIINNSPVPVNTLNYANKRELPAEQWNVPDMLKGGGDHLFRNDSIVHNLPKCCFNFLVAALTFVFIKLGYTGFDGLEECKVISHQL